MSSYSIPPSLKPMISDTGIIVRSPGRINLIGEHTDYNDGFVLPAAIDKAVYVTATKEDSRKVSLYSFDYDESIEIALAGILPIPGHWATYVLGVVAELKKRNYPVTGFAMSLQGDIPIGAGLSSSAAIECATAFALNELFGFGIDRRELGVIAQQAEHSFAGVQCGIMDQFASLMGKKDNVMRLDCRSLEFEYFPLALGGYKIVLFDSQVKHELVSSAYNQRRHECELGVQLLQEQYPEVKSLRDATIPMVDGAIDRAHIVYRRCKYVVEENARVIDGCKDLQEGNPEAFGKKMFTSHKGLSEDYDVSCPELDLLVMTAKACEGVVGSRMMGGGFGGCTINIIKEEMIDSVIQQVSKGYKNEMQRELKTYIVKIEDGTSLIN